MVEISKTENRSNKGQFIWIVLFIFAVFIYFFGLNIPLVGPDEPRYAQVAREMFQNGDWITPTLGGTKWFEKPALLYWLQIASYSVFGVSEFAARFGPAIFGLLTVASLWIFGKDLEKREAAANTKHDATPEDEEALLPRKHYGRLLALIAASSVGLITFSHGASFDIILTFPIAASLVAFFLFDQNKKESGFYFYLCLVLFYVFIGVALLGKGLVGIVFPFAIVAFYYVLSRKFPNKTFIFSIFWGTIISLVVAGTWYVPMYREHGWQFIDEFFVQHHFQRFTSNKYQHPQPFWFFWVVLPLLTLPWVPFFLAAVWRTVRNIRFSFGRSEIVFAWAWVLVPLVFFSLSGSKLPGYILPALPAALILTADYIQQFINKRPRREAIIQIVAFATFVVIAVLIHFFVTSYVPHETVKKLMETANAQGYTGQKVINLHTIEHNAEFYAPNRLVRDDDGKIKKFYGVYEVAAEIRQERVPSALVLVPLEYLKDLQNDKLVSTKVLTDNGEIAIVVVNVN